MSERNVKGFGWQPDLPDKRDKYYISRVAELPPKVDLRPKCPAPYDQGELGSCTANAIAGAIEFDLLKQNQQAFTPSRLFIYYNERVIEHSVNEDAGAMIRDGIKSVNKQGACHETIWPYDIAKFANKPSSQSYTDAKLHQALSYARVRRNLKSFKSVLASGLPFTFGFSVYESFVGDDVAKTGVVPMPRAHEQLLGGHAVMACGYDDAKQWFIVRNSWGDTWGEKGYFYMPYKYLTSSDLSDDFWMIKIVEG